MNRFIKKGMVSLLILVMLALNVQVPLAHAAMVGTEQMISQQQMDQEREKVVAFLDRTEVQQELQQQGVSSEAAKMRVAQLSDSEVQMLAGKIDALPAGGFIGTIVGAAVFIFLVLLITDVLGLTDVFPFVHHHGH